MKYLQVKLDETTHSLLQVAKVVNPETRTLEDYAILAIKEQFKRDGINESILKKPATVAAQ